MKKKLIVLFVGFYILLSIIPAQAGFTSEALYWLTEEERAWLDEHPVITYAFDPEFAPFEYYDEDGEPRGISVEVLELVKSQLGIDIEIVYVGNWSEVVESLSDQRVDLISAAPTADRRKHMHFSDTYMSIPTGFIVREGSTYLDSIEDLSGRKVSTVKGWSWNEILAEENPEIKLVAYDSVEEALNAVVYGDADATLQDFGTASYHISKNKISHLKVLEKYPISQDIAFAVRSDYEPLGGILNKTILRIDNEINQIHDTWIKLDYDVLADYSLFIQIVTLITAILVVVLLWTLSLKSQVNRKTKALQEELKRSELMTAEIEHINTKLTRSEEELRAILDADPSSIFVKDRHGKFLVANKASARTIGVSVDEMIGRSMYDFSDRITMAALRKMEIIEEKIFSGEIETDTYTAELNDGFGNRFIHEVKKLPIIGPDGLPELILSVGSDITELHDKNIELESSLVNLKKARAQLLEQEKWAAIGAFVAGIAHDVNTPLGSSITINSHLKKLIEDSRLSLENGTLKKSELIELYSDVAESAEMLDRHLKQAAELIQNFKAVSVHQINEVEESFDLCEYLNRIAKGMKYECKMKGVHIDVDCDEDIEFNGSPGLISQIFTNLISNSLTHGFESRKEGIIHIETHLEDAGVRVVYSDDGAGMDNETIEKVFMPFYTTKRDEGGSGLGMHIVNTLVTEKFGGSIDVESKPDQGVKFTILLPNR